MNDDHPARRIQRLRAALDDDAPIPADLRRWWRDGLRRYARGAPSLDAAFGLEVGPGEAWRRIPRLIERARLEHLILEAAAGLDGSESAQAKQLAYVLGHFGEEGFDGLPASTEDALTQLVIEFGTVKIPKTRTPILQILRGETSVQRDGLV